MDVEELVPDDGVDELSDEVDESPDGIDMLVDESSDDIELVESYLSQPNDRLGNSNRQHNKEISSAN